MRLRAYEDIASSVALEKNHTPNKKRGAAKKLTVGIGSYSDEYGRLTINSTSAAKVMIVNVQ